MASITTTAKIIGMDDFARNLNALGQDIGKNVLQKATFQAVAKWRERAKQLAPIHDKIHVIGRKGKQRLIAPGNLRRNIKVKKLREFKGTFSKEARYGIIITKDAWYWKFVEFGVPAYGIGPKPFLRNTFAEMAPQAFTDIVTEARAYVAKMQKRGKISRSVRI